MEAHSCVRSTQLQLPRQQIWQRD